MVSELKLMTSSSNSGFRVQTHDLELKLNATLAF